jgi:death on curing protein
VTDPDFLTLEDVLLLHEEQLARYGGGSGVRDADGLESAVAMAQQMFAGRFVHEDSFAMAAAYAFHIAQSQSFVDGNERTGLLAAVVFLDLNGITILGPDERLYEAMIAIAEKRPIRPDSPDWLRDLADVER